MNILYKLVDIMKRTVGYARWSSSFNPEEKKFYTIENCVFYLNTFLYDIIMNKSINFDDYLIILLLCGCKTSINEDLMETKKNINKCINEDKNSTIEKLKKLDFFKFFNRNECINKDTNSTIEKLKKLDFFTHTYYSMYLEQKNVINAINDKNRELIWALILLNYRIINSKNIEILFLNNISFTFMTLDQYNTDNNMFLLKLLFINGINKDTKHKYGKGNKNIEIIIKFLLNFDSNYHVHKYQILYCYDFFCFEEIIYNNENIKKCIEEFQKKEISRKSKYFIQEIQQKIIKKNLKNHKIFMEKFKKSKYFIQENQQKIIMKNYEKLFLEIKKRFLEIKKRLKIY
jgi:hypothetical protein